MKSSLAKYLYEFLMLFTAVTASFWVENYREYQNEKETIKKQLESLTHEFFLTRDSVSQFDYDGLMVSFHEICSLIRNDENFSLNDSIYGYLAAQRYAVKSDFLDDLFAASEITERAEYRHIENDSLSSFFFRLNDYGAENLRLVDWAFEMDQRIARILQKYDLQGKSYTISNNSAYDEMKPYLSAIQSQEDNERLWKLFTQDDELRVLVAELQVLHMDSFFLYENAIGDFEVTISSIEREIERL